tara:strand:+ start:392 stop:538 length:147 start_codon:yes stop_codon:yes gene_type:complete
MMVEFLLGRCRIPQAIPLFVSVKGIVNAKDTVNLVVEVCTMAQPSMLS